MVRGQRPVEHPAGLSRDFHALANASSRRLRDFRQPKPAPAEPTPPDPVAVSLRQAPVVPEPAARVRAEAAVVGSALAEGLSPVPAGST